MKREFYTNCSLVRIPIKTGISEYHLPQNVAWAGKKIEKLLIVAPTVACIDPVDGVSPVLTVADINNLYVELYDGNDRELMHDVEAQQLSHLNNNPLRVDAKLNLALCRLYFTQAPAADATLLLYVFYDTNAEDYAELPLRTMSVTVPLAANQELSFRDIINFTIHDVPATLRGVIMWDATTAPVYVTLRDHDLTYQMTDIHSELMRPDLLAANAYDTQAALFYTNFLDIDFDYSRIRNAKNAACTQKITFLY